MTPEELLSLPTKEGVGKVMDRTGVGWGRKEGGSGPDEGGIDGGSAC